MSIEDDDEFAELFKKLPSGPSSGTSWEDVAAELGALGGTLGDLLRTAWQRSEGDTLIGGLRESLSSIVEDVNRATEGSPETQRARNELTRLVESIRAAAIQSGNEMRPELLNLLREANAQLRRLGRDDK
jgi:hypothetical protein